MIPCATAAMCAAALWIVCDGAPLPGVGGSDRVSLNGGRPGPVLGYRLAAPHTERPSTVRPARERERARRGPWKCRKRAMPGVGIRPALRR